MPDDDTTAIFRRSWGLYDFITERNYMFHREIYGEVARLLLVGDIEQKLLGPLGKLPARTPPLLDPGTNLVAGIEQPAKQGVLFNDLGVVPGVAGSGNFRSKLGDVVLATGRLGETR